MKQSLLVAALVALAVTACGKKEEPKPVEAPAPAAAPARPPARPASATNPVTRAAAHPPNINEMGTAGLASNDPTEEQIENMSSDEIGALPAATRARLQAR